MSVGTLSRFQGLPLQSLAKCFIEHEKDLCGSKQLAEKTAVATRRRELRLKRPLTKTTVLKALLFDPLGKTKATTSLVPSRHRRWRLPPAEATRFPHRSRLKHSWNGQKKWGVLGEKESETSWFCEFWVFFSMFFSSVLI